MQAGSILLDPWRHAVRLKCVSGSIGEEADAVFRAKAEAGNLVVQLHAGVQLEVIWGPTAGMPGSARAQEA